MFIIISLKLDSLVYFTALFCSVKLCLRSDAALLNKPYDVMFEKIGSTARLQCRTDIVEKLIYIRRGQTYIYFGTLIESLAPRYNVSVNDSGQPGLTVLIITNVSLEDAGRYTCADRAGFGSESTTELVVIENELACEHNINSRLGFVAAELTCSDSLLEYANIACYLNYRGLVSPLVKCSIMGSSDQESENGRSIDQKIVKNDTSAGTNAWFDVGLAMNGSSVECSALKPNTTQTLVTWQSPPIKLIFFSRSKMNNEKPGENFKSLCTLETELKNCTVKTSLENLHSLNGLNSAGTVYGCIINCTYDGWNYCAESKRITTKLSPTGEYTITRILYGYDDIWKERIIWITSVFINICIVLACLVLFSIMRCRKWAKSQENRGAEDLLAKSDKLKTAGEHVTGIAELKGDIYITYRKKNIIEVFNASKSLKPIRSFTVQEMTRPRDIVACPVKYCLFVADESGKIFKILSKGQSIVVENMKVACPYTLSINSDGYIIALQYLDKRSFDAAAPEHTKVIYRYWENDGKATKVFVNTPNEYIDLHHAIELADGNYLVCYGRQLAMCKISKIGIVLYESPNTVSEEEVNYGYLYFNTSNKHIFVITDSYIFEFDQNLTQVNTARRMPALCGLQSATRLCFLSDGSFVIGTSNRGAHVIPKQCTDKISKIEKQNLIGNEV